MLSQKMLAMYPDIPKEEVKSYSNEHVSLIETTRVPFDEFTYSNYHFVIPVRNAPPIIINGSRVPMETGVIFPCNPGQPHRAAETGASGMDLYVLDLEREFFQSTAEHLFSYQRIEFENKTFNYNIQIRELLNSFMEECRLMQPGSELALQSLSILIAVALLRVCGHNFSGPAQRKPDYSERRCIERAKEYMVENLDRNFSLDELARETHYSVFHFLRIFKSSTGMTPFEYLSEVKIEKAKRLLKSTDYSMLETGLLCGFSSASHFAQAFKKKTGMSPTQYKNQKFAKTMTE